LVHPLRQKRHPDSYEVQSRIGGVALPASWRSFSHALTHYQRQVESAEVNQQPFEDILAPAQVDSPHSARLVGVRETTFHQLASLP